MPPDLTGIGGQTKDPGSARISPIPGRIFYKLTPCGMGVVLAPKHMSLANESKPDSRPGRHCVDLLRRLQNSACYSPMRIFLIVRLSYHTNSGFVQYNRDFCKKPAGEHRRKRVLPRRVSLCVEMRFIPRRRCQPRELRRPMPHRLLPSPPAARQWARPRCRPRCSRSVPRRRGRCGPAPSPYRSRPDA